MAERSKVSAEQALASLADAMVEDILATSDEEILAEMREDGLNPQKVAEDIKRLISKACAKHFGGGNG